MENKRTGYFFCNYLALGFIFCLTLAHFLKEKIFQDLNGFLVFVSVYFFFLLSLGLGNFLKEIEFNFKKILLFGFFIFLVINLLSWNYVAPIILGGSLLFSVVGLFLFFF
jgi:hypothetical protein